MALTRCFVTHDDSVFKMLSFSPDESMSFSVLKVLLKWLRILLVGIMKSRV